VAHLIEVTDAEVGYRTILSRIFNVGDLVAPRGMPTKALRNVTVSWNVPNDVLLLGVRPKLSTALIALEPLQLVGGFSDAELLVSLVPAYAQFAEPTGEFWGAYGARTGTKVGLVAERLRSDPSTRQARMSFWDDRLDLAHEGKHDYPCTTAAEFEIVNGHLCGTTYMRSNDAWLGFPYDIVQHTSLLKSLATYLHLPVGTYTHVVRNLHLYEKDFAKAREFLETDVWSTGERRQLEGGFGTGLEDAWSQVQDRARRLTYTPHDVDPASPEEEFYREVMIRQSEKLAA
jgi:hypothetical protein